jgi:hypothetical protein
MAFRGNSKNFNTPLITKSDFCRGWATYFWFDDEKLSFDILDGWWAFRMKV